MDDFEQSPMLERSPFKDESQAPGVASVVLESGVTPPGHIEPARFSMHQNPMAHKNFHRLLREGQNFPPLTMQGDVFSRSERRVFVQDETGVMG